MNEKTPNALEAAAVTGKRLLMTESHDGTTPTYIASQMGTLSANGKTELFIELDPLLQPVLAAYAEGAIDEPEMRSFLRQFMIEDRFVEQNLDGQMALLNASREHGVSVYAYDMRGSPYQENHTRMNAAFANLIEGTAEQKKQYFEAMNRYTDSEEGKRFNTAYAEQSAAVAAGKDTDQAMGDLIKRLDSDNNALVLVGNNHVVGIEDVDNSHISGTLDDTLGKDSTIKLEFHSDRMAYTRQSQRNFTKTFKGDLSYDNTAWNQPDYIILTQDNEHYITFAGQERGMDDLNGSLQPIRGGVGYIEDGKAPVFMDEMIALIRTQVSQFQNAADDEIRAAAVQSGAVDVTPPNHNR